MSLFACFLTETWYLLGDNLCLLDSVFSYTGHIWKDCYFSNFICNLEPLFEQLIILIDRYRLLLADAVFPGTSGSVLIYQQSDLLLDSSDIGQLWCCPDVILNSSSTVWI